MGQVHISSHPLVRHKLSKLRDMRTEPLKFRQLVHELATLLAYEASEDLQLVDVTVETPMGSAPGGKLAESVGLIPILRAGLGMVEGVWDLIPGAEVWHIGIYRDEKTLRPVEYYNKLPIEPRVQVCFVLDPMLATGGSAVATVSILKRWGVRRIKFVGLIGAPEGLKALTDAHPDVDVYLAALDERLNDIGFIVPGLGDAGDRQFGTG
ncbi:MAG: uracil phosphoribosyltransferase [Anaerolineae bacterium]|nr:uracil phosphoribosyltransferase [Anaerolineae bacterium]